MGYLINIGEAKEKRKDKENKKCEYVWIEEAKLYCTVHKHYKAMVVSGISSSTVLSLIERGELRFPRYIKPLQSLTNPLAAKGSISNN